MPGKDPPDLIIDSRFVDHLAEHLGLRSHWVKKAPEREGTVREIFLDHLDLVAHWL